MRSICRAGRQADDITRPVDDACHNGGTDDARACDDHANFETRRAVHGYGGNAADRVAGGTNERLAAFTLAVEIHIPDRRAAGEFQQGSVQLIRIRGEIHEQPLVGDIDGGFTLRRIILIDDRRQRALGERHAGGSRSGRVIHREMSIITQVRRPAQPITILKLWPFDAEIAFFQPVEDHFVVSFLRSRVTVIGRVRPAGFAFGIIGCGKIRTDACAVIGGRVLETAKHRRRCQNRVTTTAAGQRNGRHHPIRHRRVGSGCDSSVGLREGNDRCSGTVAAAATDNAQSGDHALDDRRGRLRCRARPGRRGDDHTGLVR